MFAAPIAHVERRVGEVLPAWHKIGLEVGMQIGAETVGVALNSTPHPGPLPIRGGEGEITFIGGSQKLDFEFARGSVGLFISLYHETVFALPPTTVGLR